MIKNLNQIKEILQNGYDYVIVPNSFMDEPIELSTMVKTDEDGKVIGYASINDISNAVGSLFTPIKVSDNHYAYRWSYDIGLDEHKGFMSYMESKGLVNMRNGNDFDFSKTSGVSMCNIMKLREIIKDYEAFEKLKEERK